IIVSVVGPHPYTTIVREFQTVIGEEAMVQLQEATGRPAPDVVIACVGGGSNDIGLLAPYAYGPQETRRRLIGVEAAGHGLHSDKHAASISHGKRGVLHGAMSYLLSDEHGQILPAHSISAGLDYPGVGPEHSYLKDA